MLRTKTTLVCPRPSCGGVVCYEPNGQTDSGSSVYRLLCSNDKCDFEIEEMLKRELYHILEARKIIE